MRKHNFFGKGFFSLQFSFSYNTQTQTQTHTQQIKQINVSVGRKLEEKYLQ
jgi:hypothetical protein